MEERNGNFKALIPFLVFAVFYLGFSLYSGDFYCVPMPIAFLVASVSNIFQLLNRYLAPALYSLLSVFS